MMTTTRKTVKKTIITGAPVTETEVKEALPGLLQQIKTMRDLINNLPEGSPYQMQYITSHDVCVRRANRYIRYLRACEKYRRYEAQLDRLIFQLSLTVGEMKDPIKAGNMIVDWVEQMFSGKPQELDVESMITSAMAESSIDDTTRAEFLEMAKDDPKYRGELNYLNVNYDCLVAAQEVGNIDDIRFFTEQVTENLETLFKGGVYPRFDRSAPAGHHFSF